MAIELNYISADIEGNEIESTCVTVQLKRDTMSRAMNTVVGIWITSHFDVSHVDT